VVVGAGHYQVFARTRLLMIARFGRRPWQLVPWHDEAARGNSEGKNCCIGRFPWRSTGALAQATFTDKHLSFQVLGGWLGSLLQTCALFETRRATEQTSRARILALRPAHGFAERTQRFPGRPALLRADLGGRKEQGKDQLAATQMTRRAEPGSPAVCFHAIRKGAFLDFRRETGNLGAWDSCVQYKLHGIANPGGATGRATEARRGRCGPTAFRNRRLAMAKKGVEFAGGQGSMGMEGACVYCCPQRESWRWPTAHGRGFPPDAGKLG